MRVMWLATRCFPSARAAARLTPGFAGGALDNFCEILRKNFDGIELCIAYSDNCALDVTINGVRHVSYQAGDYYDMRKIDPACLKRLKSIVLSFNPDLIHIQGTEAVYAAFPKDVFCGKPVVVSVQGVISACQLYVDGGVSPHEMRLAHLNLNALRGKTVWYEQDYWREIRSRQEQVAFRNFSHFIGRTEWDRQCVACLNPNARYYVVNETLRREFYSVRRDRSRIRPHSIYCSAAVGYPLKGGHWLMRAVAILKREFPDIQLRIASAKDVCCGGTGLKDRIRRGAYSLYVRQLICELGIADNIVALPSLMPDQVAKELSNGQLFVLPSLCENSSNSLGEAMLVGLPSVATCVGGTPTMLKDGVEGRLIPACDPFALAGTIRDLFLNQDLAESFVEPARKTAEQRHDGHANAKALVSVYKAVLGS